MKSLLTILLLICFVDSFCLGRIPYQEPSLGSMINNTLVPKGLILFLPINEGVGNKTWDLSLHKNDGILTSNYTWDFSPYGHAAGFDQTGGYIDCGSNSVLNLTGNLSFSIYVKIPDVATVYHALLTTTGDEGDLKGLQVYTRAVADNMLAFNINDGTNRKLVTLGNLVNDTWHHIIGTWDGATAYVYIDGIQYTEATDNAVNAPDFQSLKIGYSDDGGTVKSISGEIAHVCIWNQALSKTEVGKVQIDPYYYVSLSQTGLWGNLPGGWLRISRGKSGGKLVKSSGK